MRPLTTAELLNTWDACLGKSPVETALSLLTVATDGASFESIASLSIGQRDIRLLQLREWMFGKKFMNTANCPKCTDQVEWQNQSTELKLQSIITTSAINTFELQHEDYCIKFRLPTSIDIIKMNQTVAEPEWLFQECILEANKNNEPVAKNHLPITVISQVNERMAKEDPQADIHMLLNCPSCKHQWEITFDIVSYLLSEINAWAKNLLRDIYLLARHFGWSEQEILSMSPRRRQIYIEMVRG